MDIQMPVMDGLAATRLLKADSATASIPVLAVTGLAMPNDQERCLEAGCQGYLAKPFTPEDFEGAVLKTLSHAEPARI
jgi:two-component system cell cycle response regulator DivK